MVNMDEIIGSNISKQMKQKHIKQIELADYLSVSKQIVSKMLNGSRTINAVELQNISKYLDVSMEKLLFHPQNENEKDMVKVFMGKVDSKEAKQALKIADELADIICFYSSAIENAKEMMQPWEA